MPLTINDLYRAAANGESSWEHALLLTGLLHMDMAGLEVSPPPTNDVDTIFYKNRLDALSQYPNNNKNYLKVVNSLYSYIK